MEAHAAQAVVVQYPFKSFSLSCLLFLSCVSTFQEYFVQTLNSVSHTKSFLCVFDCKKIKESIDSQFY